MYTAQEVGEKKRCSRSSVGDEQIHFQNEKAQRETSEEILKDAKVYVQVRKATSRAYRKGKR